MISSKLFKWWFIYILLAGNSLCLMAQGRDSLDYSAPRSVEESRPLRFACNVFEPQKIALPSESDYPGYDLELITAVFNSQGHRVEFEFFPWKRAYLLVETGEFDALCSCSWLPERAEHFLYSDQMGQVSKGIFALEEKNILQLSDLRDKSVGVVSGYNLEQELLEAGVQDVHTVVDDELLLNLLLYRRVQAIYSYEAPIRSLIKKQPRETNIQFHLLDSSPYYLCVSKVNKDANSLLEKFNHGLKALRASGRDQQIIQRYLAR